MLDDLFSAEDYSTVPPETEEPEESESEDKTEMPDVNTMLLCQLLESVSRIEGMLQAGTPSMPAAFAPTSADFNATDIF